MTTAHAIYDEIVKGDLATKEFKIRELAEQALERKYDALGNDLCFPWLLPRNKGISSYGTGGTLPPAGEVNITTLRVTVPPIGNDRVAKLVVEQQIRQQLWDADR